MRREDRREALSEMREVFVDVSLALGKVARLHEDEAEGTAIREVWRQARMVLAAALVEHQRLIGVDVEAEEQRLRDLDWAPWRDLLDSSSRSETDDEPRPEATDAPATSAGEPQVHLLRGRDGAMYVAVPLAVDVSLLDERGGD